MTLAPLEPIDYLLIGHLTIDLTAEGMRLGGTAAYSALTAGALGLRVGVVTSWGNEIPAGELGDIPIINFPVEHSTTFCNEYRDGGRIQCLLHQAHGLDFFHIPDTWRSARVVHLGPVAQEVEPGLARQFPSALLGVTPQGWMRTWDAEGRVSVSEWPEANFVLGKAGAAVISIDDVGGDEDRIDELAASCPVLAVTEGALGSRVYWHGDVRRLRAPEVKEIDPTGAGDVYAAAFFIRLSTTHDPWEAARFATLMGAISVTRGGLDGVPTQDEIFDCMVEVF